MRCIRCYSGGEYKGGGGGVWLEEQWELGLHGGPSVCRNPTDCRVNDNCLLIRGQCGQTGEH